MVVVADQQTVTELWVLPEPRRVVPAQNAAGSRIAEA